MDSADGDKFAKCLLDITSYHQTTMKIAYGLIENEFKDKQMNTILRGNSLATKFETSFCRLIFFLIF